MYRLGGLKGVEGNQHMGWQGGNVDHEVAGESAGEGNVGSCEVVEVGCRRGLSSRSSPSWLSICPSIPCQESYDQDDTREDERCDGFREEGGVDGGDACSGCWIG